MSRIGQVLKLEIEESEYQLAQFQFCHPQNHVVGWWFSSTINWAAGKKKAGGVMKFPGNITEIVLTSLYYLVLWKVGLAVESWCVVYSKVIMYIMLLKDHPAKVGPMIYQVWLK